MEKDGLLETLYKSRTLCTELVLVTIVKQSSLNVRSIFDLISTS